MSVKNTVMSDVPCVVCGFRPTDRAHIKSKGAGGTWDEWNIVSLCRWCHQQQHRLGWKIFCDKHSVMLRELNTKGWVFENQFGVVKLVRKGNENG